MIAPFPVLIARPPPLLSAPLLLPPQVSFFIGQSNFNFRNILTYCEPEYVADQFARFGRLKAMLEREQVRRC